MDAKKVKVIGGFSISEREVIKNGPFSVASNRLKGSGDPTKSQIESLADKIKQAFSVSQPVIVSTLRF